uniref:Uncharacterized protein n=1 Tax=Pyxicephalus adspersus TaxID=30357 RepID=A0AAV2ZJX2_PYXAD|nr:TPA: hypothetical protein GDO54_004734 [Pyxicephalus adspersus]
MEGVVGHHCLPQKEKKLPGWYNHSLALAHFSNLPTARPFVSFCSETVWDSKSCSQRQLGRWQVRISSGKKVGVFQIQQMKTTT